MSHSGQWRMGKKQVSLSVSHSFPIPQDVNSEISHWLTKEECLSNLKKTIDLLVKLGLKLNLEKGVLEPTQSITFLGLHIGLVSMKLLVQKEKKKSFIKEIRNFLKLDCCSPRKHACLKGKLIAQKDAVIPFRLFTS
ncbi:hypothetical protein ACTFIW_003896 [Dictyostelium discoideum]